MSLGTGFLKVGNICHPAFTASLLGANKILRVQHQQQIFQCPILNGEGHSVFVVVFMYLWSGCSFGLNVFLGSCICRESSIDIGRFGLRLGVVPHACDPSTLGGLGERIS